jgi:hypothetical protein
MMIMMIFTENKNKLVSCRLNTVQIFSFSLYNVMRHMEKPLGTSSLFPFGPLG